MTISQSYTYGNYYKKKYKQILIKLEREQDKNLIAYLDKVDNRTEFIKRVLYEYLERGGYYE